MSGVIHYVVGDATYPQGEGNKLLCNICNDIGRWGAGFTKSLSSRWMTPERSYRAWFRKGKWGGFRLGATDFLRIEPDLWVANMIAQHGIANGISSKKKAERDPPIHYEALSKCLGSVAQYALERFCSIHMPRIGCGSDGGKWELVEPIIQEKLCSQNLSVYVYDLEESQSSK